MKLLKTIKYPLTILLLIIIIASYLIISKKLNKDKYINTNNTEESIIKEEPENIIDTEQKKCDVDIKGAIKKPGVYNVDCISKVNDIINMAGGLNNNADTSIINLAKTVTDEMVIIVYTKEEVKNSNILNTVTKVVEKECVCPNIQNDGCINDKITANIGDATQTENNGLININPATKEELLTIPGIGEAKAKAIINYREREGNFKTIEDIKNVDGIGSKLYEEIKIYITT